MIDSKDLVMKPIVEVLYSKIKTYEHLICGDVAQLTIVLDTRLSNDLLQDTDVLCRNVSVEEQSETFDRRTTTGSNPAPASAGTFLQKIVRRG